MLASLLEIDLFQELSSQYPVLFLIDDTLHPKYGKKFAQIKALLENAGKLFDGNGDVTKVIK